jgi:hypothetical protein
MSQFGEAEPELRPARLSRINYFVDILKGKGNTYIKGSKILMFFKIVLLSVWFILEYTVFSLSCVPGLIELQKVAIFVIRISPRSEFIAGRSLKTHSSYR